MRRPSLFWRTELVEILLVAVAAAIVALVGAELLRDTARAEARRLLGERVAAIAARLDGEAEALDASRLAQLARAEGLTLWIERADLSTLGSPATAAGDGVPRVDATAPLSGGGRLGAALPLTGLGARLARWYLAVALGALLFAAVLVAVSALAFRRVERSLAGLAWLAAGADGEAPGEPQGAERLLGVARVTVENLRRQLAGLSSRHDQIQAALASMVEAVIVLDEQERVLFLNAAARELLGVASSGAEGRPIVELVRSPELRRLLEDARPGAPTEGELALRGVGERFLQAHCARVVGAGAPTGGAVLVLNDVTRLRRLERVRRDFVANVSHEIKTPITTIAGFVETLLDGALDDKEETGRFLRIVRRHAERLESIVEDLLTLARLEQEGEAGSVATEETAVLEVLQAAVEACRFQAGQKGIALVVEGDARLRAPMNAPLIEQALVNLVDNAVKYSPERSTVTIAAEATPEETVLKVADHGTGIAAADLPRIFERFYRVDRARSRKLGGTGLGLSIVKHVASVHGGRATVESSPGEGSTFALHLPARPSSARAGTGAGAGQASSPTRETPT